MSKTPLFDFSLSERIEYERVQLRVHVAGQLGNLLEHSGLKPKDLAERMGKGRPWVSKLLGGGQNATLDTLAEAAAALGARWDAVLVPAERAGTAAEADRPAPSWMRPRASNYIVAEIRTLVFMVEPMTAIKAYPGSGSGWILNQVPHQIPKVMGGSQKTSSNLSLTGHSPNSVTPVPVQSVERLLSDAKN